MSEELQTSFIEAYNEHADAIYRFCYFRVFSQTLAEDLVQETFMKVWGYIVSGKKVNNIRPFLYRVSRNLIIDLLRKKQLLAAGIDRQGVFSLDNNKTIEPSYDGRHHLEQHVLVGEALDAIQRLPEKYRELLILRYVEGFTPIEIAKILDTTPNNVSAKIKRAVKNLQ